MSRPFAWDAPDESLLEDRRGELPVFPDDIFQPGLSEWLLRASRGAGTLLDHVAIPMLGTTSSLIGKARRVQASTSWIEPMTCWACVVAQSGDRKTPGLKVVTRALDEIEADNAPSYDGMRVKHQARVEKSKAELKRWRKECKDAVDNKREPPRMPIEAIDPGDFINPSLAVADCTIQRLAKLCAARPRGMIQIRDELAALFSSMRTMPGAGPFYLEAWNGNRHVIERVDGNRSMVVDNLLVGLIGGFQPDKIASTFKGDEDGMYGRFLYGWPTTPPYSPLTDEIVEVDPDFKSLVTKLIRLPSEDHLGKFNPRTIALTPEAREEFESYRQFVDQTKRGIEGREQQWLSKSETHVLRLAGTLAYLSWAGMSSNTGLKSITAALEPNQIDRQFMTDAIRLVREYFWPHARAVLRQIGLTDRHRNIRLILRWIRAHDRRQVSLSDIRRDALSERYDVEQTRELVERMIEAGWLRAEPAIKTGGRPKERWTANPRLFEVAETARTPKTVSAVSAVSASRETEE